MEKLKNISIIALAYLTICGSLYYLVFWKTFDLNGFLYFNFTDVIRSALYSILRNQYVFILLVLIFGGAFWEGTARKLGTSKIKILDENKSYRNLFWLTVASMIYLFFANRLGSILMFKAFPPLFLVVLAVWRFRFMEKLANDVMFAEFIRAFIIFIPLICYVAAKVNSENILQNIDYKFTIRDKGHSSDTLKYVGNSGTHFIFTDLDNTKVILLKLDSVTLYHKK